MTVQKSQYAVQKKHGTTVHRHGSTQQTLVLEERKPQVHHGRTLRLGAGAVGASAWRFWAMFLSLEHTPAPLLPLFLFTAVEETAHANKRATPGSCARHTASQVPGATEPRALPIPAWSTPSMQKLLCNSQFKYTPDFILILSPGAKHFFFLTHQIQSLTVWPFYFSLAAFQCPLSLSAPRPFEQLVDGKSSLVGVFAHILERFWGLPLTFGWRTQLQEDMARLGGRRQIPPVEMQCAKQRSVQQAHQWLPKHRGKGQQQDKLLWGEISCHPGLNHSQHCKWDWK